MTRARRIPLRTRAFIGCEGRSEVEYAAIIREICDISRLPVHLVIENLAPKGDPLGRVQAAIWKIANAERNREAFKYRFLLLDHDQVDNDPQRKRQVEQLSRHNDIKLIWQHPCHEAVLLRHLDGHSYDAPQTSALAMQALIKLWPEYRKPMERRELAKVIDLNAFRRAISVEPELCDFAMCLGLAGA